MDNNKKLSKKELMYLRIKSDEKDERQKFHLQTFGYVAVALVSAGLALDNLPGLAILLVLFVFTRWRMTKKDFNPYSQFGTLIPWEPRYGWVIFPILVIFTFLIIIYFK